jgi:hypothetical protein
MIYFGPYFGKQSFSDGWLGFLLDIVFKILIMVLAFGILYVGLTICEFIEKIFK